MKVKTPSFFYCTEIVDWCSQGLSMIGQWLIPHFPFRICFEFFDLLNFRC
jgi:hypothetical protein